MGRDGNGPEDRRIGRSKIPNPLRGCWARPKPVGCIPQVSTFLPSLSREQVGEPQQSTYEDFHMDNPPELTPSPALSSGIKGLSPILERINPPTVSRAPSAPILTRIPAPRNAAMSSPPSDAGAALPLADLTLPLARQTPSRPDGFSGPNSDSRPNPNLSRRREKPQLSCHLCRRRKSVCPLFFWPDLRGPPPSPTQYHSLAYILHSAALD